MKAATRGGTLEWGIALAVAIGGGVLAIAWFRAPAPAKRMPHSEPRAVVFTRGSMSDAVLFDKTPLFLPTKWNASRAEVKMPDASGALKPYAPKFAFTNSELKLENLPVAVVMPASPAEALAIPSSSPLFGGLGQSDETIPALSRRGGYVEVVAADSGRKVLGEPLLKANPPSAGVWQGLEFLALVNAGGLVSLDLARKSGVEEVDVYFRRFLADNFRIGARLPAGSYRISVGP